MSPSQLILAWVWGSTEGLHWSSAAERWVGALPAGNVWRGFHFPDLTAKDTMSFSHLLISRQVASLDSEEELPALVKTHTHTHTHTQDKEKIQIRKDSWKKTIVYSLLLVSSFFSGLKVDFLLHHHACFMQ